MDVVTDQSIPFPPSPIIPPLLDISLHAQQLDLDELHKLDTIPSNTLPIPDDKDPLPIDELATSIPSDTDLDDLDDILPSESFSTQVTPTGSLVDGVASRKPPISIFNPPELDLPPPVQLAIPPDTVDRTKDDVAGRCSDVEDSPPLQAAGFVGDEIPTVDPLDSDGEWCEMPRAGGMPTLRALSQLAGDEAAALGFEEEKKKKKKRKKKSKGVCSPKPPRTRFVLDFCGIFWDGG
jgi:hypothetical protein